MYFLYINFTWSKVSSVSVRTILWVVGVEPDIVESEKIYQNKFEHKF